MRAKDVLGRNGEELAARYLTSQGLEVIERNWRCELGEIDIVARDGDTLVFCEVKARSGVGFGSPFEAITPVKAARLRRLAVRWLADHAHHTPDLRIDAIGVLPGADGRPVVEHLRGVV